MNQALAASKGPADPRSRPSRAQRSASMTTPALLEESSTERRSSISTGASPNPRPSSRMKATLLSSCHGT